MERQVDEMPRASSTEPKEAIDSMRSRKGLPCPSVPITGRLFPRSCQYCPSALCVSGYEASIGHHATRASAIARVAAHSQARALAGPLDGHGNRIVGRRARDDRCWRLTVQYLLIPNDPYSIT